jgi:hypothetical protein
MAVRKRPTPDDAATARRFQLDGLAHDADIDELLSEHALLHPRDNTFPREVLLRLARQHAWRPMPGMLSRGRRSLGG